MNKILVAGGAGFLGSHLCDRLVGRGDDVLCADNFFTGDKRNILHLLARPNFELMRHDVTFPLARDRLGWEPKVGLRDGLTEPIGYFRTLLGKQA